MAKKKQAPIYLAAFLLFGGAIAWLCYTAFSENSVYFLNVSEAAAMEPQKLGHARLFGLVSEEGLVKSASSLNFDLADKEDASHTIPVSYVGVVPDTFKAGAEVIVEGGMQANGKFRATNLMTKCPSKYQKRNRAPQTPTI